MKILQFIFLINLVLNKLRLKKLFKKLDKLLEDFKNQYIVAVVVVKNYLININIKIKNQLKIKNLILLILYQKINMVLKIIKLINKLIMELKNQKLIFKNYLMMNIWMQY